MHTLNVENVTVFKDDKLTFCSGILEKRRPLVWIKQLSFEHRGKVFESVKEKRVDKKMNRFQRLNEVKELKIFFFAQRAKVPADQNRAGARRLDQATSTLLCVQQTSKYITSLLNVASPIRVLFPIE